MLLSGEPEPRVPSPGGYSGNAGEDRPESGPTRPGGGSPAHHRGVSALAMWQIPSGPASLNSRLRTVRPPPPGIHRVRGPGGAVPAVLVAELACVAGSAGATGKKTFGLKAPGVDEPEFGLCAPKSVSTWTGSSIAAIASMPSLPIWLSRRSRIRSAVLNAHCDSTLTSARKSLLRCGVRARARALAPPGPIVAPPRCNSRSFELNSHRPHAPPPPSCASGDHLGRSASAMWQAPVSPSPVRDRLSTFRLDGNTHTPVLAFCLGAMIPAIALPPSSSRCTLARCRVERLWANAHPPSGFGRGESAAPTASGPSWCMQLFWLAWRCVNVGLKSQ